MCNSIGSERTRARQNGRPFRVLFHCLALVVPSKPSSTVCLLVAGCNYSSQEAIAELIEARGNLGCWQKQRDYVLWTSKALEHSCLADQKQCHVKGRQRLMTRILEEGWNKHGASCLSR